MPDKGMVERQQGARNRFWKRWKLVVALMILFVVIVFLVLDLALKPEPGVIEHNWVFLHGIRRSNSSSRLQTGAPDSDTGPSQAISSSDSLDFKLRLVLLVSNPNLAGKFSYYNAGVFIYSSSNRGIVGQSLIEDGHIQSQESKNLSAMVHSSSSWDGGAAVAEFSARTNLTGFVSKWRIFKHHYYLSSTCDVKLSTINNSLIAYTCNH